MIFHMILILFFGVLTTICATTFSGILAYLKARDGMSQIDTYLNITLRQNNLTHWMETSSPSFSRDELDSINIPNLVKIDLYNKLFSLQVDLENSNLTNVSANVKPDCIYSDLENGHISVRFVAENVKLSGLYRANGSLMNATTTFHSDGNWTIDFDMTCTFRANLTYMNASHVRLADDYEFSCGETYSDGIITPCNLPGKLRTHIVKSRFVGLLAKVDTSEGNGTENWAGRGIEEYLENKLGSYVHKCGTVRDIVSPKFGQLVHKYLSQIFQKKSLFDMMDFEMILRYDCWIGDENCDFWLD